MKTPAVQAAIFLLPVSIEAHTNDHCDEDFYPLGDHLGSVTTLTDIAGAVVMTRHFLPFGEVYEDPDPPVSTCNNDQSWPYGFTGQYHDAESGLIYMHARYYNAAIGHFMTPDSVIPNPDDTYSYDRYAYCRNNPINLTDPTGHNPLIGAIVGAVVGAIMAAINGTNILQGALMGALAGAVFGAAAGLPNAFFVTITAGSIFGGAGSSLSGGDGLRGMIIGAAGAAIGVGFARWGGGIKGTFGQGVLAVMSGGTVGGLSSVAMGGDFWRGFTMGAVSAGLSYAGNLIVGAIAQSNAQATSKGTPTVSAGSEGSGDQEIGGGTIKPYPEGGTDTGKWLYDNIHKKFNAEVLFSDFDLPNGGELTFWEVDPEVIRLANRSFSAPIEVWEVSVGVARNPGWIWKDYGHTEPSANYTSQVMFKYADPVIGSPTFGRTLTMEAGGIMKSYPYAGSPGDRQWYRKCLGDLTAKGINQQPAFVIYHGSAGLSRWWP